VHRDGTENLHQPKGSATSAGGTAEADQGRGHADRSDLLADLGSASSSQEPRCGLLPRTAASRRNSGQSQPQMNISKKGDSYLRTLLVQGCAAHSGPVWCRLCPASLRVEAGRPRRQEASHHCYQGPVFDNHRHTLLRKSLVVGGFSRLDSTVTRWQRKQIRCLLTFLNIAQLGGGLGTFPPDHELKN
jgi:hypothetical protein